MPYIDCFMIIRRRMTLQKLTNVEQAYTENLGSKFIEEIYCVSTYSARLG